MTPATISKHTSSCSNETIPILKIPKGRFAQHGNRSARLQGACTFSNIPVHQRRTRQIIGNRRKSELLANILKVIDKAIHTNYKIYPGNYIAYDILDGQKRFADRYTNKDQTTFANYLNSQLAKIPNVTSKDKDFLTERILSMYANPLKIN